MRCNSLLLTLDAHAHAHAHAHFHAHASHSGSYSGSRSLAAAATAGGASAGLVLEGDLGTLVMQPGLARLVSHRLRWPCFKLATLRIPDRTIPKPHNVGVDPRPCRVDLSWNL